MTVADRNLVYSVAAWTFNVSTSVSIVFVNKVLMGRQGYAFNFGVSLVWCRQGSQPMDLGNLAPSVRMKGRIILTQLMCGLTCEWCD
jgi:hypothetical protein